MELKSPGSQLTTDAGLPACRELDEAFGPSEMVQDTFEEGRIGSNKQHHLVPSLRQPIYSRLAGYEDVNDAERLWVDPAMRHVVAGRAALTDKHAASTSEVGHRETEIPSIGSPLVSSALETWRLTAFVADASSQHEGHNKPLFRGIGRFACGLR